MSSELSSPLYVLRLTHWKQDLFMMNDPISVSPGDAVSGKISIIRNRHWRRHLRVSISCTHCREGVQSNVSQIVVEPPGITENIQATERPIVTAMPSTGV